jgi:predicted nucleic acid-binding protein
LSQLTLIDTSAWAHALRRNGDPQVRGRVQQHLLDERAAWCDAVRLELWAGVRGEPERKSLRDFESRLPKLPINDEVWNIACDLGSRARAAGLKFPSIDLLIFACAKYHGAVLEHVDRHYDLLASMA